MTMPRSLVGMSSPSGTLPTNTRPWNSGMVSISSSICSSTTEVVAVVSEVIALHLLSHLDVRIAHRVHGLDAGLRSLLLEEQIERPAVRPAKAGDDGVAAHDHLVADAIHHAARFNARFLWLDASGQDVLAHLGRAPLGYVSHAALGLFHHSGVHPLHVVAETREGVAPPPNPH